MATSLAIRYFLVHPMDGCSSKRGPMAPPTELCTVVNPADHTRVGHCYHSFISPQDGWKPAKWWCVLGLHSCVTYTYTHCPHPRN